MNNKINGCVRRFDAEAGVLLPISKKKSDQMNLINTNYKISKSLFCSKYAAIHGYIKALTN
jgi:hypothetical protein